MNWERSGACRLERQAVLPARLHGLRVERKALMAQAICAWSGERWSLKIDTDE